MRFISKQFIYQRPLLTMFSLFLLILPIHPRKYSDELHHNNISMALIPDDPAQLPALFAELKKNFALNVTAELSFREKAL